MQKVDWKKCDLDDIIFEYRNREYGAYQLRKKYGENIKKAAIVGTSVFLLCISSPLIADKLKGESNNLDMAVVSMVDLPKVEPPPVEPPKPKPPMPEPPKKQIATIKFTPPKVMDNPIEEPPMPKIDDITVAVSTKTQEGEKANLPPIAEPVAPPVEEKGTGTEIAQPKEDETVRLFVEQQPEFPNGIKAMYDFLGANIKYPSIARENGIEGTVYVGFVVGKDGSIKNIEVKRGIGGGCNEEAIRVIKLMPKWKPGKQNGAPVNVAYTIPVKFKLE